MNYFQRQLRRLQNRIRFGMRPWMSSAEYQLILDHLAPRHVMFEWGTGSSTVFFARHVGELHSVEHDEAWYRRVRSHVEQQDLAHVHLHLCPPDEPLEGVPNYARPSGARYRQFETYVKDIGDRGVEVFDRVLIDGRSRPECARQALEHLHEGSLVFIHDFYNTNYDREALHTAVFEHYDPVVSITEGQSLVMLRPKPGALAAV